MDGNGQDHLITTTAELEKLYSDAPYGPAVFKEADYITQQYRKLIEAAPFAVLATSGPEGLDCTPRGDPPGFVRVRGQIDVDATGPARQQPHRHAPQPRAGSAHRIAVSHPGRQPDAARQWPRGDQRRS